MTPQDIFNDVFGNDILGIKGIADSDDSSEFYEKLESRRDVWGADFYDYFHKYIAEDISSGLNPKVRRSIGLKDSYYYNNASESLNRSFKAFIEDEKLDEGKGGKPTIMSSLADTFEYYEKHVMQFRRNIRRAVFRQGPYRLTEKFRKFEIPPEAWMEKTPQERRQHLMKFDKSVKTVHSAFAEKENLIDTAASPHQNNRISQDSDQDGTSSQANLLDQSPYVSAFPTHSYQGHHMGSADHHNESNAASTVGGSSDDLSVIGDFELSGLSSIFKGSWANAGKIILKNGVGFFPGDESNRVVISLTSSSCHTVTLSGAEKLSIKCDTTCERFKVYNMCAHCLAVAYTVDGLQKFLMHCSRTLSSLVKNSMPEFAGRKENEKRKRKRNNSDLRDATHYADSLGNAIASDALNSFQNFELVFMTETLAYKCYKCQGSTRESGYAPPPPAPYDVFIRRKEIRSFRKRGTTKVTIGTKPEYVYYHPLKSCVPAKLTKISLAIHESTKVRLTQLHKQLLWREFGLSY